MTNPGAPGSHTEQRGYPQPLVGQPYGGFPLPPPPEPPKRSWVARHKILTAVLAVVGVFVVFGGIGSAMGGNTSTSAGGSSSPAVAEPTMPPISGEQAAANSAASNAPAPPPAATADDPTTKPAPPAAPALTTGQQNAIGAAKDYLGLSGFSRKGLIKQLSSQYADGYSKADATFAVDYLKVDWKAQAVRSAKEYLATTHFSRSGLIQQLSSPYADEYTRAEATYAADQVGL